LLKNGFSGYYKTLVSYREITVDVGGKKGK